MKPSPALPLTEADCAVWEHLYPRLARNTVTGWRKDWFLDCQRADRRDADIMWRIGQAVLIAPPPPGRAGAHSILEASVWAFGIDYGRVFECQV